MRSNRWLVLWVLVVSIAGQGVAHATVTAAPIDIGPVAIGSSGSAGGALSDTQTSNVTLVRPGTGDCPQFTITSPTSLTISSTPITVTVQLTPTSTGNKTCSIAVTGGSSAANIVVTGSGTGAPLISVDPAGLVFGANEVGHASASQRVTATNTGTLPLSIAGASVTVGAVSYTVTGTTGAQTVNPSGTAQWDIACKPAVQGIADGTFRISSNAQGSPTVDVSLSCSGTRGLLAADQSTLAFGGTAPNTTRTRALILSNTGNLPVNGIAAVLDRANVGYAIDAATPVPSSLAAGGSASIVVKFSPLVPTDGGNAKITFSGSWGDGPGNPTVVVVNLSAEIVGFGVNPTTVDFGSFLFDSGPIQVVHVVNEGSSALNIDPLTFVADAGSMDTEVVVTAVKLAGVSVTLPATLAGGKQLDVTMKAAPAGRIGTLSGHLVIHSTTPGLPDQTIAVNGTATTNTITVTNVDFDKVDIDLATAQTKTATLTNTGTQTIHIASVTPTGASGPFTITAPGLPADLPPGGVLSITVGYKPAVVGTADTPDTAVLDVGVSGVLGVTSAKIMISGRGVDRVLVLGDAPVFPTAFRNPGSKAPIGVVTVRNDGEAVLKVTSLAITGNPVWSLVDTAPVDIAGKSSHDFLVRFAPNSLMAVPPGELTIMSDDNARAKVVVPLTGTVKPRDVAFASQSIDVGLVGVGVPTTVHGIDIKNMDASNTFTIRSIDLDNTAFHIDDAAEVELMPGTTGSFTLKFAATEVGKLDTTATLFLDEDPIQQTSVRITGEAVFVKAHSGGGCDAGNGSSLVGGFVVGLAALLIARRRRSRAILVALAVFASRAPARADGIDLTVFAPTPATTVTGFQLQSPEVGAHGSFAISSILSFASNLLVLEGVDDNDKAVSRDALVERSSQLQLGAALAFLDRFEASARLPIFSQSGEADVTLAGVAPAHGTAIGNLALHGKVRLARALGRPGALVFGAAASVAFPTSTEGQFTGADKTAVRLLALASFTPSALASRLAFSANVGGVLRGTSEYANIAQKSAIAWGIGASVRIVDPLWATVEVFGEATPSGEHSQAQPGMMPAAATLSPIEWLAGLRLQAGRQLAIGLAGGGGFNGAIGTAEARGVLTLSLVPRAPVLAPIHPLELRQLDADTDGDGIADRLDKCPNEAEDRDGFQDDDGCPDPDNDGDGIADAVDKCPNDAEDKDGFQDDDGCPDPDNDGDGIADAVDKCPNEPETVNGIDDQDGCPDQGKAPAGAPSPQSATSAAEATFTRGRELLKQAKYREACAAFEQSQQLDPQFGTQYNIAGCDEKIGKLATAWNLYRALARSDTNQARRTKARDLAAALAKRVPKIKLVLAKRPAGLQVTMNDRDATALLDIETPVDLGSYRFVVTAFGYKTWNKTIELKDEANVVSVTIDLEAAH